MYGEVNSLVVYLYIALTSYSKYSNVNITDKGNANVRFQPLRREESFFAAPNLIRVDASNWNTYMENPAAAIARWLIVRLACGRSGFDPWSQQT